MSRRIRLRPWQQRALTRFVDARHPDFLTVATPGAGKTSFALACSVSELHRRPGRRLVVVAPTQHLKVQWAEAAAGFGLHLEPAWSSRQGRLPGDLHGIVTTYAQVATSADALRPLVEGGMAVFDEIHHAGDDRAWGSSLLTAFSGAARRLALSGTPFRSDTSPIPFVDYRNDEAVADFDYGYGEALYDGGVVRPVYFPRLNGFMEWIAPDGSARSATFDDELVAQEANQRLRTALSLEGHWLGSVLDQAHERLSELRRDHPRAAGLVIAMDQDHARGIARLLEGRHGVRPTLVLSDDPDASRNIARFAAGDGPWIVAVRMVSEGVDIPRLRLGVYATNTTTELFFRQAVGRLVRWTSDPQDQRAWFFLPDDPRLRSHAARLAEARRHNLRRRADADDLQDPPSADGSNGAADEAAQLSLFAVVGAVAIGAADVTAAAPGGGDLGVFGPAGERDLIGFGPRPSAEAGEITLIPPPPPGGVAPEGGERPGSAGSDRRRLREVNAELTGLIVRASGRAHSEVNRELNRLAGVQRISEATVEQLRRRAAEGERWLRRLT